MKVEVVEKTQNPLLQRTEIRFKVDHAGGPTPKRLDVRAQLASQLGVPEELVVIEKLASLHGQPVASGIARAYSSKERLEELEPKYLLVRGMPKEKKVEVKPEEKLKPEKPPKEKLPEKPKKEKPPEEKPKIEKPPEEKPKEAKEAKPAKIEEPSEEKPPEKPKEEKPEKPAEAKPEKPKVEKPEEGGGGGG
jgi:small subunit ribosomal protein S24e